MPNSSSKILILWPFGLSLSILVPFPGSCSTYVAAVYNWIDGLEDMRILVTVDSLCMHLQLSKLSVAIVFMLIYHEAC